MMTRLACVVAATATAVAAASSSAGAASLGDEAPARTYFASLHRGWKKPVAGHHKPVHGKGAAGGGGLPVVILPTESQLPPSSV